MKSNKPPKKGAQNYIAMALKEDLRRLNEIAHSDRPDAMEQYQQLSDEITGKYTSPEEVSEKAPHGSASVSMAAR